MRLLLYTGKGGVGKTTTAAASAVRCAELGARTLVLSADAAHSLGDVFDTRLGPEPRELAPKLFAVELDARRELEHHWGRIREYLVSLFRYQGIEETVSEELALLPGAEELTTLLAVERFARERTWDVAIVDCAPTDSTLRLVSLPDAAHGAMRLLLRLQRAIAGIASPLAGGLVPMPLPGAEVFRDAEQLIYKRLRALRRRLSSDQTSVRLVVTSERMVIEEARRAYTELCLFDLAIDAVVMNRVLPPEAAAEPFFRDWVRVQSERREEIDAFFAPLPVLEGTLAEDEIVGLTALSSHALGLFGGREPHAVIGSAPRIRFEQGAALLPLPGARAAELEVAKVEGELVVRAGDRRRAIVLPRGLARCALASASLVEGQLRVEFAPPESTPPAPDIAAH
jgi:arsenite-transporting ATPase